MKYLYTALALLVFVYCLLPKATYAQTYSPDKCGNWTQSADCGQPFRTYSGTEGSCSYIGKDYNCPARDNPADTTDTILCKQRTPLNCGSGVTVCSHADDYNCNTWCSNTYNSLCTDSERLKIGFEDPFYKTSNCKGCGHPGYPDCAGHTNPLYSGCTNNNTQACKNLYPDARIECSAYTQQVCLQEKINQCLNNNECTNAGSLPANSCPGTYEQCNPSHQCVYQPPDSIYPTCPENQTLNGLAYSCQTGSSCPSGTSPRYYTSGKICSSGQVCCYTSNLPQCQYPDPATVTCNSTLSAINFPCNNSQALTGTKCDSGYVCTSSGCVQQITPTPAPSTGPSGSCSMVSASSTGSSSGTATIQRSGFDRIDWYLNDSFQYTTDVTSTLYTSFSNLSCNTPYTVKAVGWCQNCTNVSKTCTNPSSVQFTTGTCSPGGGSSVPPNLYCRQCVGPGYTKWTKKSDCSDWTGCTTCQASDPNNYPAVEGQTCHVPAPDPIVDTLRSSVVGSSYIRDASGIETNFPVAPGGIFPYFYWIYNFWADRPSGYDQLSSPCIISGSYNGGTTCMQPDYYCFGTGVCGGKYLTFAANGEKPSSLYNDEKYVVRNLFQLIDWPTGYVPVGYYTYQHIAHDTSTHCTYCNNDCSTDPNNYTCTEDGGCPKGTYCGNYDTDDYNFRCETNPKSSPRPISNFIHGSLNTIPEGVCYPKDGSPARIDLVFAPAPAPAPTFSISGKVRIDTQANNCASGFGFDQSSTLTLSNNQTTKPDPAGVYKFSNLNPATYQVSISPPNNATATDGIYSIGIITVGPDATSKDFCISSFGPWLKTTGGDVFSNTSINNP